MKNKTCCFTGHRDINIADLGKIKKQLYSEVENLIKRGVIYYGSGGARGFDTVAAEVILDLKKKYPQIRLILVIPCLEQTKNWNLHDKESYDKIKNKADKIRIMSVNYYAGCMQARNRYMVNNSAYIICYRRKNTGGTAYTVDYAKSKNLNIIQI